MKARGGTFKEHFNGTTPQMVDMAMGPGGSSELMPEEMQIELSMGEELPEGIELAGEEEMVMVEAEVYDHNANLAEILDDRTLGELSSDLRRQSQRRHGVS